jgi:selenide,water dikinase
LLVQSIDAISALVDDPYVLGRIATLHALSDLFVAHAKPLSALALLTLPRASRKQQQDDVIHLLCGILIALAEHGISLSGGHTASAQAMQVGLSVNGTRDRSLIERPPQPDDVLVLTKPLGIGMIMAGHHHQHPLASGQMVKCAVDVMTQSNAVAAELANQQATYPMTDVTGFGLLRHARSLVDRFDPDLGISISSSALPLISGAVRLAKSGVFSSMVADNAAAVRVKRHDNQIISDALLHDPQTSGGLLIIVPPDQADTLLQRLITTNHQAAIIGTINKADSNMITIVD